MASAKKARKCAYGFEWPTRSFQLMDHPGLTRTIFRKIICRSFFGEIFKILMREKPIGSPIETGKMRNQDYQTRSIPTFYKSEKDIYVKDRF